MEKKSVLSVMLAICLFVSAMFLLGACGEKQQTPWNKTFAYCDTQPVNFENSKTGGESYTSWLTRNWKDLRFDSVMVNSGTQDWTSKGIINAQELYTTIVNEAKTHFQSKLFGKQIVFSDEVGSKLTFNGKNYSLVSQQTYWTLKTDIQDEAGRLNETFLDKNEFDFNMWINDYNDWFFYSCSVGLEFESISFVVTPYFTIVK